MSYLWTPVDVDLLRSHKTARLAKRLECSRVNALGYIVAVWCWASVFAPDGNLSHLEPEDVATAAEWGGDVSLFLPALIGSGFMDKDGTLHQWEDHQGQNFRKRLYEADKKRKQRGQTGDKTGTEQGHDRDAEGTRDDDRTGQDKTVREEEEDDALLALALEEIAPSESTREDYRRTIDRYRKTLPEHQIERVIFGLGNWKPDKPRAKLHLTLAAWLSKETPEPTRNDNGSGSSYQPIVVPEDW